MSITLKRWEPETDFSRLVIREAVEETRAQDLQEISIKKQQAYATKRQTWKSINQLIDVRT